MDKDAFAVGGITPEIENEILTRLKAAEVEHDVRILYACESGSRAWGFASPDSDFDVRFIYVKKEDYYLSFDIEARRDVIEYPIVDEIDCSGWDIRKALYLSTRTNGALLEWLNSPIKYIDSGSFAEKFRKLAPTFLNRVALCYHYSHMARGNAREYLFDDKVRLKKYFYVLRPLLAIRYLETFNSPPPVEFSALIDSVAPQEILAGIEKLLVLKQKTSELGLGDPVLEINEFIEAELERHGEEFKGQGRPELPEKSEFRKALNQLFRETVRERIS